MLEIGILEDDEDMGAYLLEVVSTAQDFSVAFHCSTLADALSHLERGSRPDVCLVDLGLPDGHGSAFVKALAKDTSAKALILTVLGDRQSVMEGFSAGAHGYLLKDSEEDQIIRHIKDTAAGANPISAQVSIHLLDHFLKRKGLDDGDLGEQELEQGGQLTKREIEVLTLFAKGLTYKEAAQTLDISPHTVNDYVKSIYVKMAVNSRNEAVYEALQMGWIRM